MVIQECQTGQEVQKYITGEETSHTASISCASGPGVYIFNAWRRIEKTVGQGFVGVYRCLSSTNGRVSQIHDMLERSQMIPLATLPFSACGSQCLTNRPLVGRLSQADRGLCPLSSASTLPFFSTFSSFFLFQKNICILMGMQIEHQNRVLYFKNIFIN